MKRAAALLACASTACTTPAEREGGRVLFSGHGPEWRVEVRERGITVRERTGMRWTWTDAKPQTRAVPGGLRYTGTLEHAYVVAGEATENVRAYTLDVLATPCTDGRPATFFLADPNDPAAPASRGCGR